MATKYWGPNSATFGAFTYCASQDLIPAADDRVLTGNFIFPAFTSTPSTTLADWAEGGLRAASHSACIVVVEAARRGRGWLV